MYNLAFCKDFSYKPEIHDLLRRILDALISDKIISIILSGSVSRGEMSYFYDEGNLKLYSDIELFVILKKRMKKEERGALYNRIKDIEIVLNDQSKFAHIDISLLSLRRFQRLPPKFQFFETKKTGKVLYGKDLRQYFPDQVDIKYINEYTLERLWSLILYFPREFFFGKFTEQNERDYKFILSRSILDIPTWILSHNFYFIPGFKNRLEFINKNFINLGLQKFLPSWFLSFLNECWKGKTRLLFKRNLLDIYEKVLTCYFSSAKYILNKINAGNADEEIEKRLIRHSNIIFHETLLRRRIYELILIYKNLKNFNIKDIINWYVLHKKGILMAFFINMNLASLNYIKENEICNEYLKRSNNYMYQLDFRLKEVKNKNFINNWLDLRRKYIEFLTFFYRDFYLKRDYYYRIIK